MNTTQLCSEEGCTKEVKVALRGLCSSHYQQWTRRNKPNGIKPCTIEECEGLHYAKGFCNMHYGRWKMHGTPLPQPKPVLMCQWHPERTAMNKSLLLCGSCYQRWYKGQDGPATPNREQSYWAAHGRVRRAKGNAAEYMCIHPDCTSRAHDWALQHTATDVQVEDYGTQQGRSYSNSPDDYKPMCRSHHLSMDAKHRKALKAAS